MAMKKEHLNDLVIGYWNLGFIWPNFKIRWCLGFEIFKGF